MITPSSTVLVLGATSDIGRAIAWEYAQAGRGVILAGRNAARLQTEADDLKAHAGSTPHVATFDILDTDGFESFLDGLGDLPETVVCVVGYPGSQAASQADTAAADTIFRTNYVGPALLLGMIANRMEQRGHGSIIAISSISGDRGRAKNYIYGSAKAGLSAFLSGLRNRLTKKGVLVVTVKAGYCRTRKNTGTKLPKLLTAEPRDVAKAIMEAESTKRDIIYVLPIWRPIMLIIRLIPENIFKRLSF